MADQVIRSLRFLYPKDIQIAISRHRGFDELCAQFQCTSQELQEHINTIYKGRGAPITKALRRNDTQREQVLRGHRRRHENAVKASRSTSDQANSAPPPDGDITNIDTEEGGTLSSRSIETLHWQEETLSAKIIALETQYKELASKYRKGNNHLRALQGDLEKIRASLEQKGQEYNALVQQNNDTISQMNQLSAKRKAEAATLSEIRREILSRQVVPICFFDDGTIEIMDNIAFEVNTAGSEEYYNAMLENPLCENLRIKEIKILASAVAVAANATQHIEPAFEGTQEEMEKIFHAIINK